MMCQPITGARSVKLRLPKFTTAFSGMYTFSTTFTLCIFTQIPIVSNLNTAPKVYCNGKHTC